MRSLNGLCGQDVMQVVKGYRRPVESSATLNMAIRDACALDLLDRERVSDYVVFERTKREV